MDPVILAGDVGGTKANLALFRATEDGLETVREATLRSDGHDDARSLVQSFLGEKPTAVETACLGVAGPVKGDRVEAPNLPWPVTREELEDLGLGRVLLINDLLATALGISELPPESLAVLAPGRPDPHGNAALIAAGTGLGEAILFWDGERRVPSASEGGHTDFAPTCEEQIALLRYLNEQYGRTSFERVLSGDGLCRIYRFLVDSGRGTQSPRIAEKMKTEDPAAVISGAALAKTDSTCERALETFVQVYGSEAGNLALKALATAGVYVGGGIAPKILLGLRSGRFLEAFRDKGRLSELLTDIPVRVILDPKTALYGAARCAARALGS